MISLLEDGVDHIRGPEGARMIVEYGDYECPYSRQSHRSIEPVEADEDLRRYASELRLDDGQFDGDRSSDAVLDRIERDFRSGMESSEVRGTPTLFIDGVVHLGGYEADTLLELLNAEPEEG